MKRLLILALLTTIASCSGSEPKIDDGPGDGAYVPLPGANISPKKKSGKRVAKNASSPRKNIKKSSLSSANLAKSPAMWKWMMKEASQFISEDALELAQDRFDKLMRNYRVKTVAKTKLRDLVKILNRTFRDADVKYQSEDKINYPMMGSVAPYILGGKPATDLAIGVLAALLLKSKKLDVRFAKSPDSELVLVVVQGKKLSFLSLFPQVKITTRRTLLARHPYLKKRSRYYYQPMSDKHFRAFFYHRLGRASLEATIKKELRQQESYKDAHYYLKEAMKLNGEDSEILRSYGRLLARDGEMDDRALRILERSLLIRSWDVDLIIELGRVCYQGNKFSQAKDYFIRGSKMDEKNLQCRLFLGQTLFRLRQYKEASRQLSMVVNSKDKDLVKVALIFRGNMRLELNKKQGVEDLKAALKLDERMPHVWGTLSEYYFQKKMYVEAQAALRKYRQYEKSKRHLKLADARLRQLRELILHQKYRKKLKLTKSDIESNLKDSNEEVRVEAIQSLLTSKHPKKNQLMTRSLSDKSPRVRAHAVQYLFKNSSKALPRILKMLKEDKSYIIRYNIVNLLRNTNEEKYIPYVVTRLEDKHPDVRKEAFLGLQDLGMTEESYGYQPKLDPAKQKKSISLWKKWAKKNGG